MTGRPLSFNSLSFVLVFLPVVVVGLAVLSRWSTWTGRALLLVAASLVFYAFGGAAGLAVLAASTMGNYVVARVIAGSGPSAARVWFWAGVAGNVALLAIPWHLAGFAVAPLGLSFYTLTQIGYLTDVRATGSAERHPLSYTFFVAGFSHVAAGPILRYTEMRDQMASPGFGRLTAERLAPALTVISIGLFKKVCLAANMETVASPVFDAASTGVALAPWEAVTGAVAYSFQLYFDFSGYSDIAIGLGWICGVSLPWNFNAPYRATSIVDFWTRWHMSLSAWLRTFLFTPMAMSLSRAAGDRSLLGLPGTTWAYTIATLTTMAICGAWHGLGWTFLCWGVIHGVWLAGYGVWQDLRGRSPVRHVVLARILTFSAVTAAWIVFRSPDMGTAGRMFAAIAGAHGGLWSSGEILLGALGSSHRLLWMVGAGIVIWGLPSTMEWMGTPERPRQWRASALTAMAVVVLFVTSILLFQGKSEFIYVGF